MESDSGENMREREREREVKHIQHQVRPLGVTQPAHPDLLQLQSTESEITLSYSGPGSTFGEISIFSSHSTSTLYTLDT